MGSFSDAQCSRVIFVIKERRGGSHVNAKDLMSKQEDLMSKQQDLMSKQEDLMSKAGGSHVYIPLRWCLLLFVDNP